VLVFTGRCYESESIPYQALDDLIDHIGQYLRSLPQGHVERLLPRNFALLVRMFPVLAPFLAGDVAAKTPINSIELRTRALGALRELFGRLNERHRVVLVIDDLQWGDQDGCSALNELVSSPDSPPVVGILAYRSEDITSSPSLNMLRFGSASSNRKTTFINLDRFEIAECRDLAQIMLGGTLEPETLKQIFEQSEGNPFLIQEIVRWMGQRGKSTVSGGRFSLSDVVTSRLNQLSSESRHFLELAAVAGQPTELPTLQLAGGTSDLLATRDELAQNRLLRSRTVHGREEVEIYHDRLRATILAGMSRAARELRHRELARALEAAGGRDSERIAAHYYQSRDFSLCAKYALKAARRASEVLAFQDAVRFFEMALSTGVLDSNEQRTVHSQCADALANAGRGAQAAEHYIAAGDNATEDERLELNLRAAEELLYSGHIERGLTVLDMVLKHVGLDLPRSGLVLPFDLLLRRLKLKIRGLRWNERKESEVARHVLVKVDTCASAATGLGFVDVLRGAALQSTRLLLALEAGEPIRIARALAMEAGYRSVAGASTEKETGQLLEGARELSERTADPRAIVLTAVMASTWSWNMGRWRESYDRACAAEEIFRDRYERLTWERDTAALFKVSSLRWMGRWAEMKTILPGLVDDARARGDLYLESVLQMQGVTSCELANDAPDRARVGLKVLNKWLNTGFHLEHLMETYNQVEISLYLGNGQEALETVSGRWGAIERSFMLRVQTLNIRMRSLLARAEVAAASRESGRVSEALLKSAEREVRKITREGTGWGTGLAWMIQAGIESLRDHREQAIVSLINAERLFEEADMKLHLAVAQHSHGLLTGGCDGKAIVIEAESALREEGIARPDLINTMLAPGRFSF